MNRSTVRKRHRLRQLALSGQIAGDILIIGCCPFEMVANARMRIEHNHRLAKAPPCSLYRPYLIRVTSDDKYFTAITS